MKRTYIFSFFLLIFFFSPLFGVSAQTSYRFASWGDAQFEPANFSNTATQVNSLNPSFTIFNGDLENNGVVSSEMDPMTTALGSLYDKTFLVRGNHDDQISNSSSLWQSYFATANRPLPSGVTNYVGLNSSSTYLTYSFDYGNSRFIGVDVPGDVGLITSTEITFIDNRLTDAENIGLTHAFIYFHGPIYCVESTHCHCSSANDGSCTPSSIVGLINKHPIVSATFHGHEHVLGWTHMSSARVAGLTREYEQFITSPSGGSSYNQSLFGGTSSTTRMDYVYSNMADNTQGFATIDINGPSFTFSIYKVGTTSPVWSKTFTKSGAATSISTPTPIKIPTQTPAVALIPNSLPGDINLDHKVDLYDFNIIVSDFGKTGSAGFIPADINKDGKVNIFDYNVLVINFSKTW